MASGGVGEDYRSNFCKGIWAVMRLGGPLGKGCPVRLPNLHREREREREIVLSFRKPTDNRGKGSKHSFNRLHSRVSQKVYFLFKSFNS